MKLGMLLGLILAVAALPIARADAKGCTERSDVVGLQRCSHFGRWSRDDDDFPRLWLDVGYAHRSYRATPFSFGTGVAATMLPGSFPAEASGGAVRVLVGIGHILYAGGELNGGAPSVPSVPASTTSTIFAPSLVAGVHTDLLRIGFSTELAAGVLGEDFDYCPVTNCMDIRKSDTRFLLEVRVGADLYVSRYWTIGVKLGRSLVEQGDSTFMLTTGIHLRAMDGM